MPGLNKFRSIVLDTINGLSYSNYIKALSQGETLTRNNWRDWGVEVVATVEYFKKLNPYDIYQILVLGHEGTGKSISTSFLNPAETYYVNLDKKPLTFPGWK